MAIDDDILEKIDGIQASKQAIIEAIRRKGVTVKNDVSLFDCINAIKEIPDKADLIDTCIVGRATREHSFNFEIPFGVSRIGNYAFYCPLPEGDFAVANDGGKFQFPQGLFSIGKCAFENIYPINEVIFPDGIEEIGDSAFNVSIWYGYNPANVVFRLPSSIKRIGAFAFMVSIRYTSGATTKFSKVYIDKPIAQVSAMENFPFGASRIFCSDGEADV